MVGKASYVVVACNEISIVDEDRGWTIYTTYKLPFLGVWKGIIWGVSEHGIHKWGGIVFSSVYIEEGDWEFSSKR
jgi:hypothetical protein